MTRFTLCLFLAACAGRSSPLAIQCQENSDCPEGAACLNNWCFGPTDINITVVVESGEAEAESESESESEGESCLDALLLGDPCDGPDNDQCMDGVYVCNADRTDVVCNDVLTENQHIEICDGKDQDCDGVIDNPPDPGDGLMYCGGDVGVCVDATLVCVEDGSWECNFPPTYSSVELCDGLDNDCNSATDDIFRTGGCYVGDGACREYGIMACQPDGTNQCVDEDGVVIPEPTEVCECTTITTPDGEVVGVSGAPRFSLHPASPSGATVPGMIEVARYNLEVTGCSAVQIRGLEFHVVFTDNAGSGWAGNLLRLSYTNTDGTLRTVSAYGIENDGEMVYELSFLSPDATFAPGIHDLRVELETTGASSFFDDTMHLDLVGLVEFITVDDGYIWQTVFDRVFGGNLVF